MRQNLAVVSAIAAALLAVGTATAGPSSLTITQTGAFNADGTGRIRIDVGGTGDDGILGNVPWLVSISVNGTALTVANMGLQYIDDGKKGGYITVPKADFTFQSGTTYNITIKVNTKSGNTPQSTSMVRFP
jgi:hypothetical protein